MTASWKPPEIGEIVWCHFPEMPETQPGPKPRPALILEIVEYDEEWAVRVIPGTSKNVESLHRGEAAITKANATAYALAGLSFDTKFDFKASIKLPWSNRYFKVPPRAPYGQTPKMGVLHPALYHAFAAAFNAAKP